MSKAVTTGAFGTWGDFVFDMAGESESESPICDRRCRSLASAECGHDAKFCANAYRFALRLIFPLAENILLLVRCHHPVHGWCMGP